jgi:T3SS negative regulator,GrlR
MLNGVYRVTFTGPQGSGKGIVVGKNKQLTGGDSGFVYRGTYEENGNQLTARIQVKQDDPRSQGVFAGLTDFSLDLSGQVSSEKSFKLAGAPSGLPRLGSAPPMTVEGVKIADV